MPLQNRVDPFGAIHAVPERGLFTGNRGIIHDPETKTLLKKRWALPAWIICVCQFRNVRREPMGRNRPGGKAGWTELFFLDEVTALAAGHRPCFFCRRERAKDFVGRFGKAFGIAEPRAPMVDKRLHKERLASGGKPPSIAVGRACRPCRTGRWSRMAPPPMPCAAARRCAGRSRAMAMRRTSTAWPGGRLRLLTPATTISVLRQGFRPAWHPSAET